MVGWRDRNVHRSLIWISESLKYQVRVLTLVEPHTHTISHTRSLLCWRSEVDPIPHLSLSHYSSFLFSWPIPQRPDRQTPSQGRSSNRRYSVRETWLINTNKHQAPRALCFNDGAQSFPRWKSIRGNEPFREFLLIYFFFFFSSLSIFFLGNYTLKMFKISLYSKVCNEQKLQ